MDSGYSLRLGLMEDWYRELLREEDREQSLALDYAPHRAWLAGLRGSVVDIGGGAGLAARYLHPGVAYSVVEPSDLWRSPEWTEFARKFREGGPEPNFVNAPGESLPFPANAFDAAISLWTLNHVRDPRECILEMARVLKPDGQARLVLEDVEPGWFDLLRDGARRAGRAAIGRRGLAGIHMRMMPAFRAKLSRRWPLQADHIRIDDAELARWLRGVLIVRRRWWLGGCLTYDLVKPQA